MNRTQVHTLGHPTLPLVGNRTGTRSPYKFGGYREQAVYPACQHMYE